ncbi:MAG: hypothetical protein MJH11_02375, partial [Lentisphaeria bacterium]|nr:hypothetical protein [Lentisphaeria bacterium]
KGEKYFLLGAIPSIFIAPVVLAFTNSPLWVPIATFAILIFLTISIRSFFFPHEHTQTDPSKSKYAKAHVACSCTNLYDIDTLINNRDDDFYFICTQCDHRAMKADKNFALIV